MFPEKVSINENTTTIDWQDGRISKTKNANMRPLCPYASCRAKAEKFGKNYIPIYSNEEIALERSEQVGNYALKFILNDGLGTGIYEFNYLLQIDGLDT